MGNLILGILLVILGYKILIVQEFSTRGTILDFTSPWLHLPLGLFFLLAGSYFLVSIYKK